MLFMTDLTGKYIEDIQQLWKNSATLNELYAHIIKLQQHVEQEIKTHIKFQNKNVSVIMPGQNFAKPPALEEENRFELKMDESAINEAENELEQKETKQSISQTKMPEAIKIDFMLDEINADTTKPQITTLTNGHNHNGTNGYSKEVNDTILTDVATMNEMLKPTSVEVAELLEDSPISDLRKSINVNDKYLFITDLFGNDENTYDRSLRTLNNLTAYGEADYWIRRELQVKYGWKDESHTAKLFFNYIRRRFA
jgi:hypothetical protein